MKTLYILVVLLVACNEKKVDIKVVHDTVYAASPILRNDTIIYGLTFWNDSFANINFERIAIIVDTINLKAVYYTISYKGEPAKVQDMRNIHYSVSAPLKRELNLNQKEFIKTISK